MSNKLNEPRPDMARERVSIEGLEDRYFCVRTDQSDDDVVYFEADRVEVTNSGALIGWCHERSIHQSYTHLPGYEDSEEHNVSYKNVFYPIPTICFAAGSWTTFFAAKSENGACIGAVRWAGQSIE